MRNDLTGTKWHTKKQTVVHTVVGEHQVCSGVIIPNMTNNTKRYWRIHGYNSSTLIFERTVELGQFSEDQMKNLLKALTAKAGLDFGEIVGAYAKRGTKIANNLLAVHREFAYPTLSCGDNPHFAAAVVDETGQIKRHPELAGGTSLNY